MAQDPHPAVAHMHTDTYTHTHLLWGEVVPQPLSNSYVEVLTPSTSEYDLI